MESSGSVTGSGSGSADDRDGAAVPDLELAGGHHLVARGKPLDDLDATLAPCAYLYLGELRLAVDDLEHELTLALRHDGLLGDAQGILLELEKHGHPREQPRPQPLVAIGHHRADEKAPPCDVQAGIDGVDPALEAVLGKRIHPNFDGLPDPDRRQKLLGNPQFGLYRIDCLEIDQ